MGGETRMKKILLVLALLGLTISCADRYGMIGAIFRLREDSPLPCWVVLPKGVSRDQVSVHITRYDEYIGTKCLVRIEVKRWHLITLQTEMGAMSWHPDSKPKKTPAGTFSQETYPSWSIIEVNGTEEVYEKSERGNLLRIVKKSPLKTYTGFPGKWQPASETKEN